MTPTDIDNLEGLELRRRVLTLLGWREFGDNGQQLEPPVESSLDAFLEHAVPFIEERGWAWDVSGYSESDGRERIARVHHPRRWAAGPRTTHPATLLCRALLKAAEAQG